MLRTPALQPITIAALCVLPLLGLPAAVRADPEQTERRLKSAGVDDALRRAVHQAIDRGVTYLASRQQGDGSFLQEEVGSDPRLGTTLLVALALRHAGGEETEAPLRKARVWLFEGSGTRAFAIERDVYHAGIALMLLASDAGPRARAGRISRSLWRGLDTQTGWWGYDSPGPGDPEATRPTPSFTAVLPNLSTTQFAGLGLQAAAQLGHEAPGDVWVRHAEALCRSQLPDGSFMYSPLDRDGKVHDYGVGPKDAVVVKEGYFTGTCMALANLVLVREALKRTDSGSGTLRLRVARAIRRGLVAFHREAARCLTGERAPVEIPRPPGFPPGIRIPPVPLPEETPGMGHHYTLYALEKACVFADLETVEPDPDAPRRSRRDRRSRRRPVAWYAAGARWLLDRQREDGGWSASREKDGSLESNPIDTAPDHPAPGGR